MMRWRSASAACHVRTFLADRWPSRLGLLRWLTMGVASVLLVVIASKELQPNANDTGGAGENGRVLAHGRYLAGIGACRACHTPAAVPEEPASDPIQIDRERRFRMDPDWLRYLDEKRDMAGGVPFIIRFSGQLHGTVYSRNITPDNETGLGQWTQADIEKVLRTGVRPDGSSLLLFPPHSFYANLADEDVKALAVYLKSIRAVRYQVPARTLPFPPQPATDVSMIKHAPSGRTRERAEYLFKSVVGCAECHSYNDAAGKMHRFAGGDPAEANIGVFRLGPDLPLRPAEKGLAAFPYPGYAVLYAPNLTRFGRGGDLGDVPVDKMVRAIREGIDTHNDRYGRPAPLSTTMLWQFYRQMTDTDAYAIADYIKALDYERHDMPRRLNYYGTDWRAAFKQVFGEEPTQQDAEAFGKVNSP